MISPRLNAVVATFLLAKLRIGNQFDIHKITEILLRISKHTVVHQRVKILTKYSCTSRSLLPVEVNIRF